MKWHEGVFQFSVDLVEIVKTLAKHREWHASGTTGKAASLVTILSTQFMVSLLCLSKILSLTQSLSKLSQKMSLDFNGSAVQVNNDALFLLVAGKI